MTKPKVAIIHDHLIQDGGAERVVRTLMKMWPEAPVYTAFYDPSKMGADFAGRDIRTSYLQKIPGVTKHYKWFLILIDAAFRRFNFSEYDLVISSASGWAKSIQTGSQTRHVCYCHTPTRYLWSDADSYIANTGYPAPFKWLFRQMLGRFRRKDLRAAAGVDEFVANSRHVADRIKRYYHRPSTVINPPVAIDQFTPTSKPGDYLLVATRLEPYKRVDLVITVANKLGLPLKIMGGGTDAGRLRQLAGPTVEFLGRVTDRERSRLFAEARAFLNPQEEDFGLTVVESLASGTPVIAYGIGGAAEIIEDGVTGVLFRPQTTTALEEVLRTFDRGRFKPAALRRRAADFSEAQFIKKLRAFLKDHP